VTVSVRDARNSRSAQLWIRSVYRDYLDDLGNSLPPALPELGIREPDDVAYWFVDPQVHPLLILKDADPVGFAMVARPTERSVQPVDYRMAEFFVARPCRRLGIGESAVRLILSRFAGRWEITQYQRNAGAVTFWRRVLMGYTSGNYQERIVNDEVRQVFDSGRTVR
jgi:predicted acetyltransferase